MATSTLTTSDSPMRPAIGSSIATTPAKDFEEEKFMKDLFHLRDSQEAIQGLSAWCIRHRKNNEYKIARCWLKCIKKGKQFIQTRF